MLLYHTTTRDTADLILAEGFKDGCGRYMTANEYSGVWLANEAGESDIPGVLRGVRVA